MKKCYAQKRPKVVGFSIAGHIILLSGHIRIFILVTESVTNEFKASNGWLNIWKKRYNVRQMKVGGEPGDVPGATVNLWRERLPDILYGYGAYDMER